MPALACPMAVSSITPKGLTMPNLFSIIQCLVEIAGFKNFLWIDSNHKQGQKCEMTHQKNEMSGIVTVGLLIPDVEKFDTTPSIYKRAVRLYANFNASVPTIKFISTDVGQIMSILEDRLTQVCLWYQFRLLQDRFENPAEPPVDIVVKKIGMWFRLPCFYYDAVGNKMWSQDQDPEDKVFSEEAIGGIKAVMEFAYSTLSGAARKVVCASISNRTGVAIQADQMILMNKEARGDRTYRSVDSGIGPAVDDFAFVEGNVVETGSSSSSGISASTGTAVYVPIAERPNRDEW